VKSLTRRSAKAGVIVVLIQLFLIYGWNLGTPKGLINMSRGLLTTNEWMYVEFRHRIWRGLAERTSLGR
jgi:hypothetical protein